MNRSRPMRNYETIEIETGGQTVIVTWFPAHDEPFGTGHGAAGICVTDNGEVVLITQDGQTWGFPGGRPEGQESWEETMRREVREEACVDVRDARLLGFSRGECVRGHEVGLVLVRALWAAQVHVLPWHPEPETLGRKCVSPNEALAVCRTDVFAPLHHRALIEANVLDD